MAGTDTHAAKRLLSIVTAIALAAASLLLMSPGGASAATSTGYVVGWGANGDGRASPPSGLSGVTAISAGGSHSLALKSDGTVVGWGLNNDGQASPPAGLSGVTAISAGVYHSLALKSDGTVVSWGNNYGQVSPPAGLSDVTAISAGYVHNLALKSDGTVVGWGDNTYGRASPPAGLSGVIAISAGYYHSLALKSDGTVVYWGNNYGQVSPPAGLSGVTAISAGGEHSLALKSDGTLVGWGNNAYGQVTPPAGLSDVTAISAGYHSLALKSDGTVVGWGYNAYGQASPPAGLSDVTAISAGQVHSLALVSSPPSAPTAFAISKVDADRTATISWQPPTNNGGSAITGYRVARDAGSVPGQSPWSTTVSASTRSFTFKVLVVGSTYTLSVQAINAQGTGAAASGKVTIAPTTANLMQNSGFELDANADSRPDNWTSNAKFTRSATSVYTGNYAGRHRATDNLGHTVSQTVVSLSAGSNYRFSGRVNIPATSDTFTFHVRVRWVNSAGGVIRTDVIRRYTAATGGWTETTGTMTSPTGTTKAQVQMVSTNLSATIYVDDFVFNRT